MTNETGDVVKIDEHLSQRTLPTDCDGLDGGVTLGAGEVEATTCRSCCCCCCLIGVKIVVDLIGDDGKEDEEEDGTVPPVVDVVLLLVLLLVVLLGTSMMTAGRAVTISGSGLTDGQTAMLLRLNLAAWMACLISARLSNGCVSRIGCVSNICRRLLVMAPWLTALAQAKAK